MARAAEIDAELARRIQRRVDALPPKLQAHIARAQDAARELAPYHDVPPEQAALGLLAHDVARAMSGAELLHCAAQFALPVGLVDRRAPVLLHGPVGAEILRREDGLADAAAIPPAAESHSAHPEPVAGRGAGRGRDPHSAHPELVEGRGAGGGKEPHPAHPELVEGRAAGNGMDPHSAHPELVAGCAAGRGTDPHSAHPELVAGCAAGRGTDTAVSLYQAVYWHTTAHPDLDALGKVVFLADKLEPNKLKKYPYQPQLRELARENLDAAILEFLTRQLLDLAGRGLLLHPMMVKTRNALLAAGAGG